MCIPCRILFLLALIAFGFQSCRPAVKQKNAVNAAEKGFSTLKFEQDGIQCQALISRKYLDTSARKPFPVSLFIEIKSTESDSAMQPTAAEEKRFKELQRLILMELTNGTGELAFVGATAMPGYRDILLYIRDEQQEKAKGILGRLKSQHPTLKSFNFESDPAWEAVSGFYEALVAQEAG